MKKEIAAFVARCDNCCRVKAVHMKAGLLQPLPIPGWKWEEVSMDFISGLPTSVKGYDSIWVIVDRLTKIARFIPVRTGSLYSSSNRLSSTPVCGVVLRAHCPSVWCALYYHIRSWTAVHCPLLGVSPRADWYSLGSEFCISSPNSWPN